jgi:hypothetical protein
MEAELMTSEVAVIPQAQQITVMDRLLSAAQGGMDIAMIERFMALAERQDKREAEKAYNKAFAEFKANPPAIIKDKKVDYTTKAGNRVKYEHATIGKVVSEIITGLAAHGLSHSWTMTQSGKDITVTCRLKHFMGHYEEATLTAAADESGGKNPIQAISSANTYLQRYTLQAVTGLAILEVDDDGRGAGGSFPKSKKQEQKKDQQKDEGTAPDRKNVEGWLKYIDDHVQIKTPDAAQALENGWKKNLEPFLGKLPEAHQNELKIAYADTLRLLQERETTK